jgi:hypothetical protein
VLITVAGWMNRRLSHVIEYLGEENRALREQLGQRGLRFSDEQRLRLAARAKGLGTKNTPRSRVDRNTGYTPGLATLTDRAEVRWFGKAPAGATDHSG